MVLRIKRSSVPCNKSDGLGIFVNASTIDKDTSTIDNQQEVFQVGRGALARGRPPGRDPFVQQTNERAVYSAP